MADKKPNDNKDPFNLESKTKLFFSAADTDTSRELLGAQEEKQNYIDALNIRVNDASNGSDKSARSIGGEEISTESTNISGYKCMGATNVGSKQVEFWAPYNPADGGIIRIDGQVMCRSVDFAITPQNLLQWDTNNDAIGGEIYITDFVLKPMYFSIKDIIDNFGITQKYFADFNINNYIITLQLPPDNIVYDTSPLVSVGTGGGLPTGQYSYSHRFASSAGDRTNWSFPTPLIHVPYTYQNPNSSQSFSGLRTLGNNPNPDTPGEFGVKMLFRVNNFNNYDFIEIRRTAYCRGEAIDYAPPSYIVKRISLPQNQSVVSIFEYVDSVANQSDELVLAAEDTQDFLSEIKRAKAIRYFFNKVILGNIEYESRDIKDKVTFLESANGNTMCPVLQNITSEGYKNPYTHAYRRMYMHAETYGFSLICWDSNFSRSLAIDIPGFAAYTMPTKREPMATVLGGDPETYTKFWNWQASTRGVVEKTFEVVDYKLGGTRDLLPQDNYSGRNILNKGNYWTEKSGVPANKVGYRPYFPQKPYDVWASYQYCPTEECSTNGLSTLGQPQSNTASYDPYIFRPQYNALGMCLVGVDIIPDWATAFSVVRSKRAGRVVSQGIAFWDMNGSTHWNEFAPSGGGQKRPGTKNLNTIKVQFPDMENGVVGMSIIDDLITNPGSYKIQMAEPLGFNSEVFHFRSCSLNNPSRPGGGGLLSILHADTQVDMVAYAACQAELAAGSSYGERRVVGSDADNPAQETGIQDAAEPANTTGYVAFGIWRNQGTGAPIFGGVPFNQNGNYMFTVLNVTRVTEEENVSHLVLELGDSNGNPVSFYNTPGSQFDTHDFFDSTTKNFTEPVYVCNLIREGATVQSNDFQSLLSTGNFVKVKSLIGYGDGTVGQTMILCGERFEDCAKVSTPTPDKYVWVEMNNDGEFFRWINISFISAPNIAIIQADIINGTTNYNGLRLYGTYTANIATFGNVVFSDPLNIPPIGAMVQVRYDNTAPVYVFGGDTFVGYANFPVVHRSAQTSTGTGDQPGDGNNYGSMLKWSRGMPYLWYKLRRNYYIARDTSPPLLPRIQATDGLQALTGGTDWCELGAIRQLVVLYTCQSYTHLPLSYNEHYPVVNYVMRPTKWDDDKTSTENHLYGGYDTDYPGERDRWQLGGLKISQFTPKINNLDYSKENVTDKYSKVSSIVFVENTWFPTRIIWSYSRPIQRVLAPNLKSFPPFNIFDISDNRGQIQRLYTFKHSGENLFAGCEDDWCEVLTRKRTLTDLTGETLGVTGNGQDTSFIQEQIWLNEISKGGLKGDFWKTFAENGDEAFYANYNGVFKLLKSAYGGSVVEITNGYFYQLYKSLCSRVQRPDIQFLQQELYGSYNTKDEEYWIRFKTQTIEVELTNPLTISTFFEEVLDMRTPTFSFTNNIVNNAIVRLTPLYSEKLSVIILKITDLSGNGIQFQDALGNALFTAQNNEWWELTYNPSSNTVYSGKKVDKELNEQRDTFLFAFSNRQENEKWLGVFDYDFDTFNSFDNRLYGQREQGGSLRTYSLGEGVVVNGDKMNARIFATLNPQLQQSYIFERARLNSSDKADIKLYGVNDMSVALSTLSNPDLKNYHAFENYVPRDTIARDKNSNTHILYQIYKQLVDKQFFANSITFFYNKIR